MRCLFLVVVLISSSFALEAQRKDSSSIIYCGGFLDDGITDTSEVVNAFFTMAIWIYISLLIVSWFIQKTRF